jgi:NADPH:quinone reductase-like Zn-dependent oxidoreductase
MGSSGQYPRGLGHCYSSNGPHQRVLSRQVYTLACRCFIRVHRRIQLGKAIGAPAIYATVATQKKVELCQSLGATAAWNYWESDWEQEVKAATKGKGVDIIIDFVEQKYFQKNLNSAARDGRIVIIGLLSGAKISNEQNDIDLSHFVTKRLRVEGSRLRSRDLKYQRALRGRLVKDALPGFLDGRLKVRIEEDFDWNEIQAAHRLMESNTIMGKIVCRVT